MPEYKHLAVDFDDVLCDFTGGLKTTMKKEYDVDIEFTEWDLAPVLEPVLGRSWWEWMRERSWLWGNVFPAIDGAIGGLDRLHKAGHYIEILTAKPEWARHCVAEWMGKWRPYYDQLTIVGMDTPKYQASMADILVDDKWGSVEDWVTVGARADAILFERAYRDSGWQPRKGVHRAKSWQEVVDLVGRLT